MEQLTSKISQLDFNLNGTLCKYITWNNKILPKSETMQKRVFYYVLGLSSDKTIHDDLRIAYENFGAEYINKIEIINEK